jgi:ribosomal-protein-alanine N-acetyltransferase
MQEPDLAAVAALEAQAHPAPWTAGNFRDALAAGYSTVVGEADGAIVAYGVLMMGPGEAQVLNRAFAPAARR